MSEYISVPALFQEVPSGRVLAIITETGYSCFIDNADFELLQELETPADIPEIIKKLELQGWDDYSLKELPEQIETLKAKGLIYDLESELARLSETKSSGKQGMFDIISWPTKNRHKMIKRAMDKWIKVFSEYGYTPDLVIADDSDSVERESIRSTASDYSRHYPGKIFFISRDNVEELIQKFAASLRDSLNFALGKDLRFNHIGGSYGVTRNISILAGYGKVLAMADDDIIPDFRTISTTDKGLHILSDTRGFQVTPLHDGEQYPGIPLKKDPFLYHKILIGENAANLIKNNPPLNIKNINSCDFQKLIHKNPRIKAVCFGSYGDAGMDNKTYLLRTRSKLSINFKTGQEYKKLRESRNIFRSNSCLSAGCRELMGMHFIIDERDISPPFSPLTRTEDALWPTVMEALHPDSLVAHPPLSLHHNPGTVRQNKPVTRGKLRIGLNESLQLICSWIPAAVHYKPTYENLSRSLMNFSQSEKLPSTMAALTIRSYTEKQRQLHEQLKIYKGMPENWAEDVRTWINSLELSMDSPGFWLPWHFRDSGKGFRDYIFSFGKLIQDWPEIFAFMKENRDEIMEEFRL